MAENPVVLNRYHRKIGRIFGGLKISCLLLLIGFIAGMVFFFNDSLTYANLRYLLKDFNFSIDSVEDGFDAAYYEKQQNMSFALFRGELAVSGNSKLSLFPAGSSSSTDYSLNYSNPVMLTSDKYLLCYDRGGRHYSLYTSLANVVSTQTTYDILTCAISQSGAFAICTRSSTAKYQVEFWNASVKRMATYSVDDYVFALAISEDGTKLAILSASMDSSNLYTKLRIATVGRSEFDSVLYLGEDMPLQIGFFSGGNMAVLCDTTLYFLESSGKEINHFSFSSLSRACLGKTDVALVLSTNAVGSENDVICFDENGQKRENTHVSFKINYVALGEDRSLILISPGKIVRIFGEKKDQKEFSGTIVSVLSYGKFIFLCRTTNVTSLIYENGGFQ